MANTTQAVHDELAEEELHEQEIEAATRSIADAQRTPRKIPGPVSSVYGCDVEKVTARLNQLRSTEIVSYLQYKQHAYMAVSLLGPAVKSEFLEHAEQELQHADRLADRISQLGGTPLYDLCEIGEMASRMKVKADQGTTIEEMVYEDLEIETQQVINYTKLIREVGDGDPVTRRLLEDILIDTEHHASELRDLLMKRAD